MAVAVSAVALLAAAPFPSHEGHGVAADAHQGFPFVATVGLYVLVVLAGSLAAPALSRTGATGRLRAFVVGAVGVAYAGLVVAQVIRGELSPVVAAGVLTAAGVGVVALARNAVGEQAVAAA